MAADHFYKGRAGLTESKLLPLESMANRALQETVAQDGEVIDPLAEFQKLMGRPSKVAGALIAPADTQAKGLVDARSPATLQRAALAIMASASETDLPPEEAVNRALERAGIPKEMLSQMFESPDWAGTMARFCQQYFYVTHLPRLVSAQITKGLLGDTAATKFLTEMFGKNEDNYDEQTKAMAEADPETRRRHTKALIEDLQRLVDVSEGAAADKASVEAVRAKAIAEAQDRKDSLRK